MGSLEQSRNVYIIRNTNLADLISTHESHEYLTHNVSQNERNASVIVYQRCHITVLKDLIFMDNNLSLEEFKNIMKSVIVDLTMGGNLVCRYQLSLLMELNPVQKVRDTFVVKIPSEMTIPKIILIAMSHCETRINISGINHIFEKIKLITHATHINSEYAGTLAQNACGYLIQQFQHVPKIEGNILDNVIDCSSLGLIVKGFFINGRIENIKEFEIVLNERSRQKMDYSMINSYCRKISDNLIFYSFNGQNNYESITETSHAGALNASEFKSIKIKLKLFEVGLGSYEITALSMNILRVIDGVAGLAYSTNIYGEGDWIDENKELDLDRNNDCPILRDIIGNIFGQCVACKYHYDYKALRLWLKTKNECPMCREEWTNKTKYTRNVPSINPPESPNVDTVD